MNTQKTILLSVLITNITIGLLGSQHYQTKKAEIEAQSNKIDKNLELTATHPYNHCIQIAMSESSKNGKSISAKEAGDVCSGLQGGDKPDKNATANIKANKDKEISMVNASKNKQTKSVVN